MLAPSPRLPQPRQGSPPTPASPQPPQRLGLGWLRALPGCRVAPGLQPTAGDGYPCPACCTLSLSLASGSSHPKCFKSCCCLFCACGSFVDALLIEVRLALLSVIVIPCIYFYCMQLHLRGGISVSLFLVGLCVCVEGWGGHSSED